MMFINFSGIAILNIHRAGYRCIISGISKSETINLMQNIDLTEKIIKKIKKKIKNIKIYYHI